MTHLMPRMSRQLLIHLLLTWLLLVASLHDFCNHSKVQAIESAHFKGKPAQPSLRSHKANIWPSWYRLQRRKFTKLHLGQIQ
ncbi:hypothetical protein MANES_11G132000v8 [Manihot esculenta]|uniref:Uncharacterized protein n=1 Tax=Manihot esculenta TaxID=3983 RepID=A0ACB7GWW5_MANES|nr:hypothetical protein MANES_11G132000v8 [Manihot esculenta]